MMSCVACAIGASSVRVFEIIKFATDLYLTMSI